MYDGQGNLAKKTEGGSSIVYIGGMASADFPDVHIGTIYEKNVTTGEVTKYYWAFGRRVAMRKGSTVSYLLADHLTSTRVAADAAGAQVGRISYYPYGNTRSSTGTIPTDKLFAGGQQEGGRHKFGVRYYSTSAGRLVRRDRMDVAPVCDAAELRVMSRRRRAVIIGWLESKEDTEDEERKQIQSLCYTLISGHC